MIRSSTYHLSAASFMSPVATIIFLLGVTVSLFGQTTETAPPAQTEAASGTVEASTIGDSQSEDNLKEEGRLRFVRLKKDASGNPAALQTAIVRYELKKPGFEGCTVDLIGAVHIGHKSYYEQLNKVFREYDALLYELVADPEANVPEAEMENRSVIGQVQVGMKDVLGLDFQLDHINYEAKNFVHADMSPGEFVEDMEKRKDGFAFMLARMIGSSIAAQATTNSGEQQYRMMKAAMSDSPELELRRVMAESFESMEIQMSGLEDKSGRSTLVTERNRKAFEVLASELNAGKKSFGIFYGAAHLDDMHERLIDNYEAEQTTIDWLDAWNLAD